MGGGMMSGGNPMGPPNVANLSAPPIAAPNMLPNVPPPPDTSLSAPVNSRIMPTLTPNVQGPSMASRIAQGAGKYATALQPLFNAIPGMQQGQGQQQQQPRNPVNFNAAPLPYIPPPGGNQYGY